MHEEKLAGVTGLRVSPRLPSRTCFGIFLLKKNISEKITFINVNKNIDKVKGGGKINYFIKGVIKK